ncbi:hypothetical protein N7504_001659 [Penicillium tannophilum]|nr:hypothetical protein N7504_001659 [Penicillium tannophilum]
MPLGQHVETIDETVDRLLKKKLNGTDKHFLYVLSSREAEGKFKIGVCKDHPSDNRIDQHDKCYPNSEIRFIQMSKCAYRVEQLILAEFREYQVRLKEGCWVCFSEGKKVQHKEWLNVEEDILLERIFEWHDFFIGRPHNMSAAGPHSPPRQASPGRPKDLTPRENSGSPLSRSLTPRDGSPSPSSTAVWGMKKVSRNSPQPLSPPANSGRGSLSSSSRPSLLLNDNPIPFSITDGNIGRFSGEAPETPGYSTLTKSGRPSRPKLGTDNGGESGDSTESVTTLTWLMRNLGF